MEISVSALKKIGLLLLVVVIGIGAFATRSAWWPKLFSATTADAAGPQLTPDLAKATAEKAALDFYTVDSNQETAWFADFKGDTYYSTFDQLIKPALWPVFTAANLKSVARLEGESTQVAAGVDKTTKRQWEVWKVNLSLDQLWPGATPPRPFNVPSIVSLTWPQAPQFSVFVLVTESSAQDWEVSLFPSHAQIDQLKKITPEATK